MKLGSTKGTFYLGRYKYKPVLGYVTKAYFQGARYNFKTGHKNRLNTEIAWGKFSSKYEPETDKIVNGDSSVSWLYSPASINTAILNLSYPLDRKTKLYGGAYWLYTDRKDYHGAQIFEIAGQHQHNKEFKSYFDVARSNADSDRMLYYYGLKYHNDSIQQPKSWSWMLQYAWHEAKATINSDLDIKNYGISGVDPKYRTGTQGGIKYNKNDNGAKGLALIYKYVPLRNSCMVFRYQYYRPINHFGNKYNRYSSQFRAEWDVFFK